MLNGAQQEGKDLQLLPILGTGVAAMYNIPGIQGTLVLNATVLGLIPFLTLTQNSNAAIQ